ncbi:hypothetical protein TWF225_000353 [Orbilia oligospora]|uniref:Uncharacterized protein n=1 Tax=Orbilia oligospora TaxID=2813651 RepID=A0A7C8NZW4_ORBOL|nr:hypothetical protein TWF751_004536 [Orbilia oligospora]KAF3196002.1 hypothetical protein TWF225_000353 [Orbilia oligospora]KAF3266591.1 hypothetical protein TWF128_010969 [Orbilia oligospora]KAF3272085.1 hypothetical protein TWF217_003900 [Orbilia oligospora]KAF3297747.1 hypothetical protein TWF132_006144 [Orbilia oligospora]
MDKLDSHKSNQIFGANPSATVDPFPPRLPDFDIRVAALFTAPQVSRNRIIPNANNSNTNSDLVGGRCGVVILLSWEIRTQKAEVNSPSWLVSQSNVGDVGVDQKRIFGVVDSTALDKTI